ncbi:MAG: hypothetical protein ACD_28C00182G0001 [uncultured bacterium]|nr:MAG: hypothetical protein ACD_28C00182G0001 [uncultured bacterium]
MRYHVTTYGCQMNSSDTERLNAVLEHLGYEPVASQEEADLLFFNTCSIRQKAENKLYGLMRALKRQRQERPNLLVGITGCMVRRSSTRQSVKKDKLLSQEAVDIALRIEDLGQLGALLQEVNPELTFPSLGEGTLGNYFKIAPKRESVAQAWIPIQTGCDKFCTFCIVPYSRGRERSRPMEDILAECTQAVENGALEITLIGQTVDSYGLSVGDKMTGGFDIKEAIPNVVFNAKIFESESSKGHNVMAFSAQRQEEEKAERPFVTLLREIDRLKANGLKRLRFTSPHPQDFSEDLIVLHKELETLQPYIHLPVQSGSNRILKAMRRTYTHEHYRELIALIRKHLPSCAISTDVIVGFSGENEDDFQDSYNLLKELRFDMAFLAQYSPRRGTFAGNNMKDDVSVEDKARRFHELNRLLTETSRENHERFVGQAVEVLVEKQEGNRCSGRTTHFKQVFFESGRPLVGRLVEVKINEAHNWFLEGELV